MIMNNEKDRCVECHYVFDSKFLLYTVTGFAVCKKCRDPKQHSQYIYKNKLNPKMF